MVLRRSNTVPYAGLKWLEMPRSVTTRVYRTVKRLDRLDAVIAHRTRTAAL